MSISLGVQFQQNLHKMMQGNEDLKRKVSNIYQSLKTNYKYPYILQHINSIKLLNSSAIENYEITGEINIYLRDGTFNEFKEIIIHIEKTFIKPSITLEAYNFISAKIVQGEFTPSQDLLTTRLKMSYLALIQNRS